jgi:uncharacterized protein (DUF305 family)
VSGLVVLGVVLAGCGSAAAPAGPAVIVPGGPGESAQVLPGAEAAERRTPVPVSPADVEFVAAMVPHHRQALELAALAPGRAVDAGVLAIADRISAVQGAEIAMMQSWLDGQDDALGAGHGGGHGGHDGELHPGMATPEQVAALGAATGPAFDRMFLDLMIAHHEGALVMADAVRAGGGTDVLVSQMADDVTATQSAEISRMRDLLA